MHNSYWNAGVILLKRLRSKGLLNFNLHESHRKDTSKLLTDKLNKTGSQVITKNIIKCKFDIRMMPRNF